jgi:LmbE family N-acetylglucosaminyl deacetylase
MKELELALEAADLKDVKRISLQIPDQEASLHLAYLIRELHRLETIYRPEVVFTHPYEGGHPDHDACAFATQRAVAPARATGHDSPALIEATFYHLRPKGMRTGCFLPPRGTTEEISWPLSPRERKHKQELLTCFASQQNMLRHFTPKVERFRIAPQYAFHEPPHAGPVLYDHYAWGMSAQRFCELARAADAAEEACR